MLDGEQINLAGLASGTYFARVFPKNGPTYGHTRYQLQIAPPLDVNDDRFDDGLGNDDPVTVNNRPEGPNSPKLGLLTSQTTLPPLVMDDGEDWFQFTTGGVATSSDPLPPETRALASHESPPLSEMLRIMNKPSRNLHAEMLLRVLGSSVALVGIEEQDVGRLALRRARAVTHGHAETEKLKLVLQDREVASRRVLDQRMQAPKRAQMPSPHLTIRSGAAGAGAPSRCATAPVISSRSSQVR